MQQKYRIFKSRNKYKDTDYTLINLISENQAKKTEILNNAEIEIQLNELLKSKYPLMSDTCSKKIKS